MRLTREGRNPHHPLMRLLNSTVARCLIAFCLLVLVTPLVSCSIVSYSVAVRDYMNIPKLRERHFHVNEKG
ncbi:MAG: hypothetical protein NTY51_12220, partial [Deltaproteobacteria bacterium]|nr:hypothetical protein [Deltaproteobacteria bacterium]